MRFTGRANYSHFGRTRVSQKEEVEDDEEDGVRQGCQHSGNVPLHRLPANLGHPHDAYAERSVVALDSTRPVPIP